jgi:flagellar motility protein MotE (MotC chaperone)
MEETMTRLTFDVIAEKIRAGTLEKEEYHEWEERQKKIEAESNTKQSKIKEG